MLVFFRNKTVLTTTVLLALGAVMGIAHHRARASGTQFFIADVSAIVVLPAQIAARRLVAVGNWLARAVRSRKAILEQNASLRAQVRRLTSENARLREIAVQHDVLRKKLGLRPLLPAPAVCAEVVSRKESAWFDTATINRGRRAGIVSGAAVVNHLGLVGQVVQVFPFSAQITTLSDPASSVGAMVQRSRSCGIVKGQGEDYLSLVYLPKDADVRKNDIVVSSGLGGVVHKGYVIGRVMRVERDPVAGTTSAVVKPSVRMDQLEIVFVVNPKQEVE